MEQKEIDIGFGLKIKKVKRKFIPSGVLYNEYEIKNILQKLQGRKK